MLTDMNIKVTDPLKTQDRYGSGYISYQISSNADRKGFLSGGIQVTRRYNDFAWLAKDLSKKFPGVIVPPIPGKQAFAKVSDEFIETRRRALEKFLCRLSEHHLLGFSDSFIMFLEADEETIMAVKVNQEENVAAQKSSMTERATTWMNSKVMSRPEVEETAADIKINDIAVYVKGLQKQINAILKKSEALLTHDKELSNAYLEFSQSFTLLGQSEGDALGTVLFEFGKSSEDLSHVSADIAMNQQARFLEPLEEYSRLMESIKTALSQRQEVKSVYIDKVADLAAKQQAYKKLLGVPGKESQAVMKESSVSNAEEAVDKAKAEYESVSRTLLREFEVFKSHKAADIKMVITNFVNLQIEFNTKAERIWSDLYPRVEGLAVTQFDSNFEGYASEPSLVSFNKMNLDQPPALPPMPPPKPPINPQQHSNFEEGDDDEDEDSDGDGAGDA
jgi:sorting nexin-1/2